MRSLLLAGMFLIFAWELLAFNPNDSITYTREIRLQVDNDVYMSLFTDKYYSSGIFGIYRKHKGEYKNAKVIRTYTFGQRIFTPMWVGWTDVDMYDYPYSGHLSVMAGNQYYTAKNYLNITAELGWMGPKSQTGNIQTIWHDWFGLPMPRGWKYQVGDSPILNLYGTYTRSLAISEGIELLSETNGAIGTAFTNLRQEFTIRIGRFFSLERSLHVNGQLGTQVAKAKAEKPIESYLFYGYGREYNFYNATIEGNLFGKINRHKETPVRGIGQHRLGFMFAWNRFDMAMVFHFRSEETTEAMRHKYGALHLNYRIP